MENYKREFIEYRRVCVIINTVCLFLQLPLYLPDRSYQDVDSWGRKEYIENTFYESWNYKASKYRKIVNKGAKSEELINEILSRNDRGRTARSFCWSLYIDKWDELEKAARAIGMC